MTITLIILTVLIYGTIIAFCLKTEKPDKKTKVYVRKPRKWVEEQGFVGLRDTDKNS